MLNTTVVLRECGERTADLCYDILCATFTTDQVTRISETPFKKSLSKSLQLGIEKDREFILCVDADVLPFPAELITLIKEMEIKSKHVVEIQGLVFDNFFQVLRPAGNHLYRTSLASKALTMIPSNTDSLRPESEMLSKLIRAGNPWAQSKSIIGYHDFEQSHGDIYRKMFLTGIKHAEFSKYLIKLWSTLAPHSEDFVVAKKALLNATKYNGPIKVDKSFLAAESELQLRKLDLTPQIELDKEFTPPSIEALIARLPADIRELRNSCEKTIHRKIFYKPQSLIRQILAFKVFERVLS